MLAEAAGFSYATTVRRQSGKLVPKPSLPVRLVLLVTGTTLPLIAFAAVIVFHNYHLEREQATQRVLATVRGIRFTLDAQMRRVTGGLQVLALTDTLRNGDFAHFTGMASGFLDQYGKDGVIVVADREGHILYPSAAPPLRNSRETAQKVFEAQRPQYSDVFVGVVNKKPVVTVEVPVFRNGKVAYDISFRPPLHMFQEIVETQRPGPGWTVTLLDGNGVIFARVPNPRRTVGKHVSASLRGEIAAHSEATLTRVSREGVPLITAFVKSPLTGWTVAAGISEHSLVAPLWRNLAIASAIGGVLLLIGLAFAVRMATTIARGEMLQGLLIEELNHRVKNTLSILQAIAVQTFRSASPAEREKFEGRLGALAEAHSLLGSENWQGSELQDVLDRVLRPYLLNAPQRITMSGPHVPLRPRAAVVLSMIVHEIATNAAKYGALSNDGGAVSIAWDILNQGAAPYLRLIWTESGGPPVTAPAQRGFGSRLIERIARDQLGGEATVDFRPEGVIYTVNCALNRDT
jgi:two-component sensor histidine kinase